MIYDLIIHSKTVHCVRMKLSIENTVSTVTESVSNGRIISISIESGRIRTTHCEIVTCYNRLSKRSVHMSTNVCVGLYYANKAPLVSENLGQKTCVLTRPDSTDTVEGGHNTVHISLNYAAFKCCEIYLTDSLLVRPDRDAVTVSLLIVESKVLCKDDDASVLKTSYLACKHLARDIRILGVIFPVSAREGAAVNVRTGSINTRVSYVKDLHTECITESHNELGVKGRCHYTLGGEAHKLLNGFISYTDSGRAVLCNTAGSTCAYTTACTATGCYKRNSLFPGDLVEKVVPHRIVIISAPKVEELNGS